MKLSLKLKMAGVVLTLACALAILASGAAAQTEKKNPERIRRKDAFLGVHFDFHAGKDCTEIGKNTTRAMIENVINQIHPDYLQIDCKGHPGLSSYPTKAGNPAPGFVGGDPLRLWRQVTAEHGVALFMHYSGVLDYEAVRQHPDWAALGADGKPNTKATSPFGGYDDQLMIPQLRELAGDYAVDGTWVDGECWGAVPDYRPAALAAFRRATGIGEVPRKPADPHWFDFLQFQRETYRGHLRHYIAELRKTNPAFQICSNWAFTDHMPEPVSADVDWISGDLSPDDSVNAARISARYMARQGKPWDLMAWGFSRVAPQGKNWKPAVQLEREAALVLAQGGGFAAYYTQKRDGSVREEQLPVMAEVARFCRARQAYCQGATPVPQIALLYSTAAHYREINTLYGRDHSRFNGTLQALLEGQQVVDLVGEHQMTGHLADWPLIILPETTSLEPAFKKELMDYARGGGKLLLIGPEAAALFQDELGATLHAESQTQKTATSIVPLGQGRIAVMDQGFSKGYLASHRAPEVRALLNGLVHELFPYPLVELESSNGVDVMVNRIHGKLAVNLVNTSDMHWDTKHPIIESIAPVENLRLTIRTPDRPKKITLEPGGRALAFEYRDGAARLSVPKLEIHSIVVVE